MMNDFLIEPFRTREQQLRQARTASDVAAVLYPKVAQYYTAFLEAEVATFDLPHIELLDFNDDFWAHTLGYIGNDTTPILYVTDERQFRRYNPETGINEPIPENAVISQLSKNLDRCASHFPQRVRVQSLLVLKNRQRLKAVVERAKEELSVTSDCFQPKPFTVAVSNGILNVTDGKLIPFSPLHSLKQTLPLKYDPQAKCEVFLKSFLTPVVRAEDIDLLQRYLSQLLDAHNYSQAILVLTGEAGWGKSTLMKIIGSVFGWNNAGIIRQQVFTDRHELSHYQGKRFLYHPDMPTEFLNRGEASLFKQLVGGDPIWAEAKSSDEMITIQGNLPVILACNGKPKIKVDCDADAWLRRLAVVEFGSPMHDQHMGKLAEMIVRTESSGILNWLLEGRRKLVKDKLQLPLSKEQRERAATLLLGSESPKAFVRSCVQKQKDGVILMADIYEEYQKWCRHGGVRAFASREFMDVVKEEIETTFGLRPRHDLQAEDGKAKRGWSGLQVVDGKTDLKVENWSAGSVNS